MRNRISLHLPLAFAMAAMLSASPALAQGKGKGQEKSKARHGEVRKQKQQKNQRPELRRRSSDTYEVRDDRRYEDRRYEDIRYGDQAETRGVPAFCRSGAGHPVHGRRWCDERRYERNDSRYEDTYGGVYSRGTYDGRSGSYEDAHREFHYYLDRKYSELSSRRPLDIQYQIRIRADKRAEHERWHAQAGRRHQ